MRIIVLFKEKHDNSVIEAVGGTVLNELEAFPTLVIAEISEDKLEELKAHPDILEVEEDQQLKGRAANSSAFTDPLNATYWWDMLQLRSYWDRGLTGKGVKVGILDVGVNQHYQLKPLAGGINSHNNALRYDKDINGHGTGIAGVIAAYPYYSWGWGDAPETVGRYGGVAPDVSLYSIRATDDVNTSNATSTTGAINGLNWAVTNKMDIVSISFGLGMTPSDATKAAFKAANDAGIILVCAAGNDGTTAGTEDLTDYPGKWSLEMSNLITIAGIDKNYKRALMWNSGGRDWYSSTGTGITMAAPGVNILTTTIADGVGTKSSYNSTVNGTSYSAPMVAGLMALYKQAFPTLTANQLINKMKESCKNIGTATQFGLGVPLPHPDIMKLPRKLPSKGLYFDGNSDGISCGAPSQLNLTSNMTFEVRVTQEMGNQGYVLSRTTADNTANPFRLYLGDDGVGTRGMHTVNSTPTSSWGAWGFFVNASDGREHTVTMVISGLNWSYYLDGLLNSTGTLPGAFVSYPTAKFEIGHAYVDTDNLLPFKGYIHSVRAYNRALSGTEVSKNIDGNVTRSGLVLEYVFTGKEKGTVTDTSGNNIVGTLRGAIGHPKSLN